MRRVKLLLPMLLLALAPLGHAQIYADVSTSMGAFTIQLNYTAAPQTVANFITLAEGTKAWVDETTGAIHTNEPFYNGITFHRVIKDFMSQTGSRKGDGSDGPGYTFRDELNGLTHSGPHVVSMANGGPNTNGSQFFITDVATPSLNGIHTVFGTISSGGAVVDAINNVATTNEKPNTPVTIQSIAIRREGTAAQAFNEHAQNLPVVSATTGRMNVVRNVSNTWALNPSISVGDIFRAFRSATLGSTWSELPSSRLHVGIGTALLTPVAVNAPLDTPTAASAFYHLSVAHHPGSVTPSHLSNRTVRMPLSGGVLNFTFTAAGNAGTTTYTPTSGSPLSSPFTLLGFKSGGHDLYFIADSPQLTPRYFLPKIGCDSATNSTISGRHSTQYYDTFFGWQPFESGACTISR